MGKKTNTDIDLNKLGEELIQFMNEPKNLWLKEFAIMKGFPSEYLSRYAKKSESFNHSLKKAKDIQEAKLVRMGFSKKFNPAFVIFALKNVAGWRDKSENEIKLNELKVNIKFV